MAQPASDTRAYFRSGSIGTLGIPIGTLGILCALQGPPAHLAAQEIEATAIPVSLIVSGGVSRGTHQGGVNWAVVEFLRRSTDDARFRASMAQTAFPGSGRASVPPHKLVVATGASAGNINSILSALEWCRDPGMATQLPENSLFWKIWVRTGWEQLFPDDFSSTTTNEALFETRYFDTEQLRTLKRHLRAGGPRRDCQVPIGLTITKMKPDSIPIDSAGRISALTQRIASVFEVSTDSIRNVLTFKVPEDTVFRDRGLGRIIRLPPLGGGKVIDPDTVFLLTKASSAFPAAFAPVRVPYQDPLACPRTWEGCPTIKDQYFLDGGAFDNNPLDLAYGIYDAYEPQKQHPHSRIVYIDPDGVRTTGSVRQNVEQDTGPQVNLLRGIGAVVSFASGYMQSSAQYELQSFARTLARHPQGAERARWLRVTDRYHPITGNFVANFGAFFGRPFREYDFYVGIYDGLLFVAREMVCTPALRTRTGSDPALDDPHLEACTSRVHRSLLSEGHLPLSTTASEVISELFTMEHPYDPALPSTSGHVALDSLDQQRLMLLRALLPAIDSASRSRPAKKCEKRGLTLDQKVVCSDNFGEMLRLFGTLEVKRVIERDAHREECQRSKWPTSADVPCLGDRTLLALIDNPERATASLLANLLHQAWRVENRLAHDRKRAGSGSTYRDYQALTEWAEFFYRTDTNRTRNRGWDRDPSTIHNVTRHWWRSAAHLLPYHLGTNLDAGGAEAGWRPTYHFSRHIALVLPFGVNYRPGRLGGESSGVTQDQQAQWFGAGGVGLLWKSSSTFPRLANAIDAVELSPQYLRRIGDDREAAVAANLSTYLLAGKIRVGLRYLPERNPGLLQAERFSSSVAIADFNGLTYWFFRSLRN